MLFLFPCLGNAVAQVLCRELSSHFQCSSNFTREFSESWNLVCSILSEEGKGFLAWSGPLANCVNPHISVTLTDFLYGYHHPNDMNFSMLFRIFWKQIFIQSGFARKKL
jgi:hypothetical protein